LLVVIHNYISDARTHERQKTFSSFTVLAFYIVDACINSGTQQTLGTEQD